MLKIGELSVRGQTHDELNYGCMKVRRLVFYKVRGTAYVADTDGSGLVIKMTRVRLLAHVSCVCVFPSLALRTMMRCAGNALDIFLTD